MAVRTPANRLVRIGRIRSMKLGETRGRQLAGRIAATGAAGEIEHRSAVVVTHRYCGERVVASADRTVEI